MSSFHAQTFENRHGTMGDTAEQIFDTLHAGRVHKLGLNRYWDNGKRLTLTSMTHAMRYAPDRMVGDRFVEIMGIGRDQTLKIKIEKMVALQAWSVIGPVTLFVYDSKNGRWWEAPVADWYQACNSAEIGTFSEGKRYFALHSSSFPGGPTDVEAD